MRRLLGMFVLLTGWVVLSLIGTGSAFTGFNFGKHAKEIESHISTAANNALGETTYDVQTSVSGRDITLSGDVFSEEERTIIIENLETTDGHRVVRDNLKLIKTASPYTFEGMKTATNVKYSGFSPTAATLNGIIGYAANDLTFARGIPDDNWVDAITIGVNGLNALSAGKLTVSDRKITLSGIAGSLESEADIQTALSNLPTGYSAEFDLMVEPTKPYIFIGKLDSTGETYEGYIPSETARDNFAGLVADQVGALIPKAGMPDTVWPSFVGMGVQGLRKLNAGEMRITDRTMILSGAVDLPQDIDALNTSFSNVPDGYTVDINVSALDDGTPAEIKLDWNAKTGGTVSGKSANDLSIENLADAINLPKLDGSLTVGKVSGSNKILMQFAGMAQHLHKLESLNATITSDRTLIDAVLAPRENLNEVRAAIINDLGPATKLDIRHSLLDPSEGDTRVNENSTKREIYRNGFWVPFYDEGDVRIDSRGKRYKYTNGRWVSYPEFDASQQDRVTACQNNLSTLLTSVKVTFETGSADLTNQSKILINSIGVVLARCLSQGDLTVEVGGHTDDQGSDDFNLNLSETRAAAVREALIATGLQAETITAKGYGESWSIADNATPQGRAQNRRTTFIWSKN